MGKWWIALGAVVLFSVPAHTQDDGADRALDAAKKLLEEVQESSKRADAARKKARRDEMAARARTGRRGEWSCDRAGARVAAVNGLNEVEVWLDDDDDKDLVLKGKFGDVRATVFHPTAPEIFVVAWDDRIHLCSLETGETGHVYGDEREMMEMGGTQHEVGGIKSVSFSPDGRFMVLLSSKFGIADVFDAEKNDWLDRSLTDELTGMSSVRFLPDSKHALVESATGLELQDVTAEAGEDEAPPPVWKIEGGRDRLGFGEEKKTKKPLGTGVFNVVFMERAGLVITKQWPILNKEERPYLAAWSAKTGKRTFRVPISDRVRLIDVPLADTIYVRRAGGPTEAYEIDLYSKRNGKKVRTLKYAAGTPQPRLIAPDGKTAFDTDREGKLVRFSVFPVKKKAPGTGK